MDSESNDMEKNMETSYILMPRGRLAVTLLMLYGKWILIILFLLTIICLTAGIFLDVRWVIIALMLVFIATPAILCYLYFFHGLRRSTSINSICHTFVFSHQGIKARIFHDKHSLHEEENDQMNDQKEQNKSEDDRWPEVSNEYPDMVTTKDENHQKELVEIYCITFPYTSIEKCIAGSHGYILKIKAPEKGFIWLPYTSFPTQTEWNEAVQLLRNNLS